MPATVPTVIIGLVAGAVTPAVAARYGVRARWWVWCAVGAVAGAGLGWRLDHADRHVLVTWLVALAVGVPLAAIDLRVHRLPDPLVLPAVAVAAVAALAGGAPAAVGGGAALTAGYAVLAVLPRSGLGFGDVKLAGLLGTALALRGWSTLGWGAVLAFGLGGVVAGALLATRRARRDTPLPFGPPMLLGAWLALLGS